MIRADNSSRPIPRSCTMVRCKQNRGPGHSPPAPDKSEAARAR